MTPEQIADKIMDAYIDPEGLAASDILNDDQAALLHTNIVDEIRKLIDEK